MASTLRIGISACFFHADPQRAIFKGKTLLYCVDSIPHFFSDEDVVTYLIPSSPSGDYARWAADLDGLVLEGGADVAPESYGETAIQPQWGGDAIRDRYEIALVKAFLAVDKPILGICRGLQLLNVALGGTLYQDIGTQVPNSRTHRNWEIYDQNFHEVEIAEGSRLRSWYGRSSATVNSVHHQGIKTLGKGLEVEAISTDDGIVEAVSDATRDFVYAVQWHPEFHNHPHLLDGKAIARAFYDAARRRKKD